MFIKYEKQYIIILFNSINKKFILSCNYTFYISFNTAHLAEICHLKFRCFYYNR